MTDQKAQTMVELADKIAKAWRWEHLTSNGKFVESLSVNEQETIAAALRSTPAPGGIEAREALEPFARTAANYDASLARTNQAAADEAKCTGGEYTAKSSIPDAHRVSVTIGDCRKAQRALAALQSQPEKFDYCCHGIERTDCEQCSRALQSQPVQPAGKGERNKLVQQIATALAEGKDSGGYDTLLEMYAHTALSVIESALPVRPNAPVGVREPGLIERMQAFVTAESKNWVNCGTGALEHIEVSPAGKLVQEALDAIRPDTTDRKNK